MDAETNGAEQTAPEGTITIAIQLTPTPNGYAMNVNCQPPTVFPDTIIEACGRAIRFFERALATQATVQALQGTANKVQTFNREAEAIRRRLS